MKNNGIGFGALLVEFIGRCMRSLVPLAFLGCVGIAFQSIHAQNTGTIFGNVIDQNDAAIVHASITVKNADNGITRTVDSGRAGEYQISDLPVGTYTLTASARSFESTVITDITIDANSNVKEVVAMRVGRATESVVVQDTEGSVIDARSATVATLIPQKLIDDLPIDGHNIVALAALLPGVVNVNAPSTFTNDTAGPTYTSSGGRATQNLMLFDGLMWNNLFYNTGVNFPTHNALDQVSVLQNNFKAEYGRNAGSVFNVLTRSGTNQFHGAVWDYLQNQMFNATDYITQVNPKNIQNQYGFTLGGPIRKDKLHFFVAYQQLIGRLQTTAQALTPTYADRGLNPDGSLHACNPNGAFAGMTQCADFSDQVTTYSGGVATIGRMVNPIEVSDTTSLPGAGGVSPQNVVDSYNFAYQQAGGTGTSPCIALLNQAGQFAASHPYGNVNGSTGVIQSTYMPYDELPSPCFSPVMVQLLKTFVPYPNTTGATSGFAVTESPSPTGDRNLLLRTDWTLDSKRTIDARYNYFVSTATNVPGVSNSVGIATYEPTLGRAVGNFGNIGYTWVLSPNLLSTTRAGYKRFESTNIPTDSRTLDSFGANLYTPLMPVLPSIGFSGAYNMGNPSQAYSDHINEDIELQQAFTWIKGTHSFKGGVDLLRLQYLNRSDYAPSINFSVDYTAISVADAMGGLLDSVTVENRLLQGGIQNAVFSYFQDDWRATPKLTVNLGVRYELPFQWFEPHHHAATFVPGLQSTVFPNAPSGLAFAGDPTVLPSLVPTDYHGIAPRFGFAYDVYGTGKLLIRGGYGIFFDSPNANVVGVGEPFHYMATEAQPPGSLSVPLATYGYNTSGVPDGSVLTLPQAYNPSNPVFFAPYSVFFPDRNFRTPYVEGMNFGFQYRVPHGGVLDANYIGRLARKLTIPLDLNPTLVDPQCTGFGQVDPHVYCIPYTNTTAGAPIATLYQSEGGASSSTPSRRARARYEPFNFGGQGIVDILSVGTSSYHALQLQYTERSNKYLTIMSSFTYSKAMDIQTNAQTTSNSVPDVRNLNSDYGPSDNNVKFIFNLGWVARLPKVNSSNMLVRSALNNWVYSGSYVARTGRPFSVTMNSDGAFNDEPNQRAAFVPGVNPRLPSNRHRTAKIAEWINPNAFTYPIEGTFSNQSRNSFVGPGYIMTDMTLGRDFQLASIREGMRLNFRAEGYNVFNTPNLANPSNGFACTTLTPNQPITQQNGSSTIYNQAGACEVFGNLIAGTSNTKFGRVLSTYGNNANTSTNGRKMQFALTLYY